MSKPRYVIEQDGRFYFRRTVPEKLRKIVGKTTIKQQLGADKRDAYRRAEALAVEVEWQFQDAEKAINAHTVESLTDEQIKNVTRAYSAEIRSELLTETERSGFLFDSVRTTLWHGISARIEDLEFSLELGEGATEASKALTRLLANRGLQLSKGFHRDEVELILTKAAVMTAREVMSELDEDAAATVLMPDQGTATTPAPVSPPPVPFPSHASTSEPLETFDEFYEAFQKDPSRKQTADRDKNYRVAVRAVRETLGGDYPASHITRRHCEAIREIVMRLPDRVTQRFPDLTLVEAADRADREGMKRLGPSTVNTYLRNLSALFRWGVRTHRVDRNPAEGLTVVDPVAPQDKRNSFSTDQLNAIFSAPIFTGCVDDERNWRKAGPNHPRRGRFWIPLISLWTGMRLTEICQLHTQDIQEIDGVECILISDTRDQDGSDKKRVKTASGRRFVPIHPELKRLGFVAFANDAKSTDAVRLFSELTPDSKGSISGAFGKWFNEKNRFLGSLGFTKDRVSFHSFRHNYRDRLRKAGVGIEHVNALGGWKGGTAGGGQSGIYGNEGISAALLYESITRVEYPELEEIQVKYSSAQTDDYWPSN